VDVGNLKVIVTSGRDKSMSIKMRVKENPTADWL
jgi:hypothetical protein